MTREYVIEQWGVESTGEGFARAVIKRNELIAEYTIDGGCPGDDLTPPDPSRVEVTRLFIEVFEKGVGTLTIEAPDLLYDTINIRELEETIEESLSE